MFTTTALALAAAVALQPQTDTTFAVPAGARLQIENHSGSIRIGTWDRSEVRVRADHGSRDVIDIGLRGSTVRVQAERSRGMAGEVDYELTLPRAMAVAIDGVETDVTADGMGGDLVVHTVDGDVTVRGAGGAVELHTVEGDVEVDGGVGRITIDAMEGDVRISGAQGILSVETVEGDVTLENVESADVDVGSVEGDIAYSGPIRDGGRYRLTSHEGDITLMSAPGLNATIAVATFDGSFEADPAFSVQVQQMRPGRRFSFTLGSGSARIELETFEGEIRLERR